MINPSVVIPVYNAASYVQQAVESALAQPETAEVILAEDGSSDDSLRVCEALAEQYDKVTLYRHPGGVNKGAGATRNLGIKMASSEWIAFLDADDFYLPQRFKRTQEIINADDSVDAVFEATGVHFYSDDAKQSYLNRSDMLTTFQKVIAPETMFESFCPIGKLGYAVPSGAVVRKVALMQIGMFDERVYFVHEDTILFIKLAAKCRATTGELDKPVALRGAHETGHLSDHATREHAYVSRLRMWNILYQWAKQELTESRLQLVKAAMGSEIGVCYVNRNCRLRGRIQAIRQILLVSCICPRLLSVDTVWLHFLNALRKP